MLTRNVSHATSLTELCMIFHALCFGVMLQLGLVRHSMHNTRLDLQDANERWKSLGLPWAPPRVSQPLGTTGHVHLLMEHPAMCCLSNLNLGWFTTIINDDFCTARQCFGDDMASSPSTSLEGVLRTSWCFQPPWNKPWYNFQGLIPAPYATNTALSL